MSIGVSYFGNRILRHVAADMEGLAADGFTGVLHTFSENDLAYYREMGMSAEAAAAFYALTNSVPFEDARWLDGVEMRRWINGEERPEPGLAYLDLSGALN